MSVAGGQQLKNHTQIPVIKQQNTSNALFQSLITTSLETLCSSPLSQSVNYLFNVCVGLSLRLGLRLSF